MTVVFLYCTAAHGSGPSSVSTEASTHARVVCQPALGFQKSSLLHGEHFPHRAVRPMLLGVPTASVGGDTVGSYIAVITDALLTGWGGHLPRESDRW